MLQECTCPRYTVVQTCVTLYKGWSLKGGIRKIMGRKAKPRMNQCNGLDCTTCTAAAQPEYKSPLYCLFASEYKFTEVELLSYSLSGFEFIFVATPGT